MLCYRCFSSNLPKIYKTAILKNFFWCIRCKNQWSSQIVVSFNPLMLWQQQEHTYLNRPRLWKSCSENVWETPRTSFRTKHILNAHNYANYELCCWSLSKNLPKIFRTVVLKENPLMNVPYFIKKYLWMNAFDEAFSKKYLVEVDPSQSWPWKQNGTTAVAAVVILEVVKNWKKHFTDKYFDEKGRLWTLIIICYRKCMLPLQYLSDRVYMA